jgi:hypothetical protein
MVRNYIQQSQSLVAKCRKQGGAVAEFDVLDISQAGCLVNKRAWSLKVDDRVMIKLADLNYQPVRVAWVEDDLAGLEFEQLLYEPVYERFKMQIPPKAA